ncbi:MAG: antitoxin Xre/MbcA/ParS toxin-binding domain-containing protein [Gemmatimonadota bacterium]
MARKKSTTRSVRETAQRPYVRSRIESARRAFRSDAELAASLGVARSQLTRWKTGQEPDAENAARLAGMDAVVELLTGFLSPRSIAKWLASPNAHLSNRRPLALLRAGRLSEVIAAIEAEKGGAFA